MSALNEILTSAIVILCVAISWTCSTQFTKTALNIDQSHFYAPYSLVWFNTCFMSICFPVFLLYNKLWNNVNSKQSFIEASAVFGDSGLTIRSVFLRVSPFVLTWIAANYFYSQSLGHISASAAASILSSNTLIVGILSWLLLKEKLTVSKCLAVVFAIAGVVIISIDKEFVASLMGVCLALISAFTAAVYKVGFKLIVGNATLSQVSLFMSCLGLFNMFLNFPPTVVFVATGLDYFEWKFVPWLPLMGAAILAMVFNFCVNFGIALLSPLIVSIGMLFGLPLNTAIDILFRDMTATPTFLIGASLLLISFVLAALPVEELLKKFLCGKKKKFKYLAKKCHEIYFLLFKV